MPSKAIQVPHIVVVGGGAGGLELVTRLGQQFGKKKRAVIRLIDSQLTHVWKPLLHEVAAGTLDSHQDELNYLTYAYKSGYEFQLGEMVGVNRAKKYISLAAVMDEKGNTVIEERKVHYDYLVIAVGSQANTFSTKGADKYCYFLDSRAEAELFHTALVTKIIQMRQSESQDNNQSFSTVIVGAGASGVELAAELINMIQQTKLIGLGAESEDRAPKITLIEANDRILPYLPEWLSAKVYQELVKMGVQIHTNQRVVEVNDFGVQTEDGLEIIAPLKVWVAGIKSAQWLSQLDGLEVNRANQLVVRSTLQTTHDDCIFVLGDCCAFSVNKTQLAPPRAQVAHQQASLLFRSIKSILKGRPLPEYKYKDYGSLIHLSSANSVGSIMGGFSQSFSIEGKLARLVYWALYKMHQLKIYGLFRWLFLTLGSGIASRVKPRLKLH